MADPAARRLSDPPPPSASAAPGRDADAEAEAARLLGLGPRLKDFLRGLDLAGGTSAGDPLPRIARYRVVRLIGEGGMGSVYEAEQDRPVRRRVALKVIKPGMDSRQVLARFDVERGALALMDHPHIARVFDAGATDAGRPFFAMELVNGAAITDYCDAHSLPVRQRVELFVAVCRAVEHAHQKGVIHRDLKPTNVLVTLVDGKPAPKVIDFGIAKATESRPADRTALTEVQQLVGTPEYMSPEQAGADGGDVDTRSDVYSLGVLLYELLTGTTPFAHKQLRGLPHEEVRRIVREVEPPKPSTRLKSSGSGRAPGTGTSPARGTDPAALLRAVRGELDWIVMRCLEKDRARRYQRASELAADLERRLRNEPVRAGPPTVSYRARKFLRRRRAALAVAAAIIAPSAAAVYNHLPKPRASGPGAQITPDFSKPAVRHNPMRADVDGNRSTDLIFLDQAGGVLTVRVAMSDFGGTGAPRWRSKSQQLAHGPDLIRHRSVVADVNGDGRSDLVFFGPESGTSRLVITSTLSRGDGTWAAATGEAFPNGPRITAEIHVNGPRIYGGPSVVGDFNGDRKSDLAFVFPGWRGDGLQVLTKFSLGNGKWASGWGVLGDTDAAIDTYPIPVGDFDGDGNDDLIVTAPGPHGGGLTLRTKFSRGDGVWDAAAETRADLAATQRYPPLVGDFNGDRKADVVFLVQEPEGRGLNIRTLFSRGDGTWAGASDLQGDRRHVHTYPTLVRDVNGDGKADLVFVTQDPRFRGLDIRTKLSRGDGTWVGASDVQADGPKFHNYPTTIGDVNRDGKADLMFVGMDLDGPGLNIRAKLSRGDGTWDATFDVLGDGAAAAR